MSAPKFIRYSTKQSTINTKIVIIYMVYRNYNYIVKLLTKVRYGEVARGCTKHFKIDTTVTQLP